MIKVKIVEVGGLLGHVKGHKNQQKRNARIVRACRKYTTALTIQYTQIHLKLALGI